MKIYDENKFLWYLYESKAHVLILFGSLYKNENNVQCHLKIWKYVVKSVSILWNEFNQTWNMVVYCKSNVISPLGPKLHGSNHAY